MATLTGAHDNTLSSFSITNPRNFVFTQTTPTEAIGEFRSTYGGLYGALYSGTGFTYASSGALDGGTVTAVTERVGAGDRWLASTTLRDVSIPVSTLTQWPLFGGDVGAATMVFAGDDIIQGTPEGDMYRGYDGNDRIVGDRGNDKLYGDSGDDILIGDGGDDRLYGGAGDDILVGGPGSNTLSGGDGRDTVTVQGLLRQAVLSGSTGNGTVSGTGFRTSFETIEVLRFTDGTMSYVVEGGAAQVSRLYQAALGRMPDAGGLAHWSGALRNGASPRDVAASFLDSPEFQGRFPSARHDADGFVRQLYQNVLGRAPDGGGHTYWTGLLTSGQADQAGVLASFAESAENKAITAPNVAEGVWTPDQQAAQAARIYYATLGRAPDAVGLNFWIGSLWRGTTLVQQAQAFTESDEFMAKYGSLTNSDFVGAIYTNVLGRPADAGGQAYWTEALDGGAAGRAGLIVGFSESPEHRSKLAPVIEDRGIIVV